MVFLLTLISFLQDYHSLAYIILFLGAYSETLIITSFFIYGEIFFLGGGILAGIGVLNIFAVYFVCLIGALLGDSSSFFLGMKYGKAITKRFFRKGNRFLSDKNFNRAKNLFHKYGKKFIFFARFMGPASWITPFLAGTLHIKYKDFIKYNIPGVIGGVSLFVLAGYFLGFSYVAILPRILTDLTYAMITGIIITFFYIMYKTGKLKALWKWTLKIVN